MNANANANPGGPRTPRIFGLGHVPERGKPRFAAPMAATMPRSEWREFDVTAEDHPVPVKDQGQYGACNGHAAATSAEWARWLDGMTHAELSPWFVYAILCGGVDRGSNIGQALDLLRKAGTCRFGSLPWGTIDPNRINTATRAEAVNYRVELGESLPDFDAIMTAVQLRRPGNLSVRVIRSDLFVVDDEGVVPVRRGAGDHAVAFVPAAKKLRNGEWAVKFQNSWTDAWGDGGYGWITRRHYDDQSYREAYSVVAPLDTPGDPTNPPPVS